MSHDWAKRVLTVASDASGAYQAACAGQVVLVIDVIDMGTTLEAALQAGALLVLGASPASSKAPVPVNPVAIGRYAAGKAEELQAGVVVAAEPRTGDDQARSARVAGVLRGLREGGLEAEGIYPNQGAEFIKLVDCRKKIVIAVTDCGGVAFDTAFNAGAPVISGTVARTCGYTGWENAESAVKRAVQLAAQEQRGLCIVASSSKALEDILAAQYCYMRALALGFHAQNPLLP